MQVVTGPAELSTLRRKSVRDWQKKVAELERSSGRLARRKDHFQPAAAQLSQELLAANELLAPSPGASKVLLALVHGASPVSVPSQLMCALAVDGALDHNAHVHLAVALTLGYLKGPLHDRLVASHLGRLLDGRYRDPTQSATAAVPWKQLLSAYTPGGFLLDNLFALAEAYETAYQDGDRLRRDGLRAACRAVCQEQWAAPAQQEDRTAALRLIKARVLRLPQAPSEPEVLLLLTSLGPAAQAELRKISDERRRLVHQRTLQNCRCEALDTLQQLVGDAEFAESKQQFEAALDTYLRASTLVERNFADDKTARLLLQVLDQQVEGLCRTALQWCLRHDRQRGRDFVELTLNLTRSHGLAAPVPLTVHALYAAAQGQAAAAGSAPARTTAARPGSEAPSIAAAPSVAGRSFVAAPSAAPSFAAPSPLGSPYAAPKAGDAAELTPTSANAADPTTHSAAWSNPTPSPATSPSASPKATSATNLTPVAPLAPNFWPQVVTSTRQDSASTTGSGDRTGDDSEAVGTESDVDPFYLSYAAEPVTAPLQRRTELQRSSSLSIRAAVVAPPWAPLAAGEVRWVGPTLPARPPRRAPPQAELLAQSLLPASQRDSPTARQAAGVLADALAPQPALRASASRLLQNLAQHRFVAVETDLTQLRLQLQRAWLPPTLAISSTQGNDATRALNATVVIHLSEPAALVALRAAIAQSWDRRDIDNLMALHHLVRKLGDGAPPPAPWTLAAADLAAFNYWQPRPQRLDRAASLIAKIDASHEQQLELQGARRLLQRFILLEGPTTSCTLGAGENQVRWNLAEHPLFVSLSELIAACLREDVNLKGQAVKVSLVGPQPLHFAFAEASERALRAWLGRMNDAIDEVAEEREATLADLDLLELAGRYGDINAELAVLSRQGEAFEAL